MLSSLCSLVLLKRSKDGANRTLSARSKEWAKEGQDMLGSSKRIRDVVKKEENARLDKRQKTKEKRKEGKRKNEEVSDEAVFLT